MGFLRAALGFRAVPKRCLHFLPRTVVLYLDLPEQKANEVSPVQGVEVVDLRKTSWCYFRTALSSMQRAGSGPGAARSHR